MNPDPRLNKTTSQHQIDLPSVVRITRPTVTWEQLNHPQDATLALKNICQDFKPGQGMICQFAGERGTGQSLAAQAMAKQLGKPLIHVDLTAVVNKYVGETEKNLNRIFDSAATQDAILFFDEADALFGKRTEVKDSHDRYANSDIDHLLQRIETFQGLVILASNVQSALDSAFMRRIRFVIKFPT
jgi:SpoVK/Ycf46/Vps4 family AAA+-type ATPase